jgi:hypothetical protein
MDRHRSGNDSLPISLSLPSAAILILPVSNRLAILVCGGTVPASYEGGVQKAACHRHSFTQPKCILHRTKVEKEEQNVK